MKHFLMLAFIIAALVINCPTSHASVTVDSVSTINSSCTNNGSATVYATSTVAGNLFYAIVAGPSLAPIQNSNIFSSLYPGLYTARVYNVNFDSVETQFTIGGNYQLLNFNVTSINPTCTGFNDGSITATLVPNTGLAPYTYQIVAPVIGTPQPQNYFPGLDGNTYQVRVTDGCGNYQTRTALLVNTGTGLVEYGNFILPNYTKIGCDTMVMLTVFNLFKEHYNYPLTLTYVTPTGTISKPFYATVDDTINVTPGKFTVTDTLPGLTYGDSIQVFITDTCGASVHGYDSTLAPFEWFIFFNPASVNCVATYSASLDMIWNEPMNPMTPVVVTVTDLATNIIVDSIPYWEIGIELKAEVPGNFYRITITDGCGETWQQDVQWPIPDPPEVFVYLGTGCRDSSATIAFECLGFQSLPTVRILSGPPRVGSTKPHFAYSDTLIYPVVATSLLQQEYITIKDFAAGTYGIEVTDTCGTVIDFTLTLTEYDVTDIKYIWYVKPSCLNNNTMYYNFNPGGGQAYDVTIKGVTLPYLNHILNPPYSLDSITTLLPGKYAVQIIYLASTNLGGEIDASLANSQLCWWARDTIELLPYTNGTFITNTTVYCNGTNYVELIPDSSRGVPPYQYSIISGPQTFPLQSSSVFQIQQFGNYLINMEDVCGNNYSQQITVSSDSFPPIIKAGFFCDGSYAALYGISSPYFSYVWQLPGGGTVTGDSLVFDPFAIADTGWYHVLKIVNINGCRDTLETDYYLPAGDTVAQNLTICQGDSVTVGMHVYYLPGVYYDTLTTANGCDSIVVLNISLKPAPTFAITTSADTVDAGGEFVLSCTYTQALNYYWHGQAEFGYADSISTTAIIESSQWLYLSITDSAGCVLVDSVLIFTNEIVCDTCAHDSTIFIPNVFTPDGDGTNEAFYISNLYDYKIRKLTVYNRWGKMVYSNEKYNNDWNSNGLVAGTYYFVLELFNDKTSDVKRGYVEVIK